MKLQISEPVLPVRTKLDATRDVYNRYSGMMLGYLVDIVKDRQLAENYLVEIFSDFQSGVNSQFVSEQSLWTQLQQLAKSKLLSFIHSKHDCRAFEEDIHSKWTKIGSQLATLTAKQRAVFCGMYYHQKPAKVIAGEINESEEKVKQILKEVFIVIRNGR